jgi:uncharacterized phage protein (TIGR01671 family)
MDREIEFRGKDKDTGEWRYGFYGYIPDRLGNFTHMIIAMDEKWGSTEHHVDPTTVGQYTGLTDVNGRKIFEGDIVRTTSQLDEQGQGEVYFFGEWLLEVDPEEDAISLYHEYEVGHALEIIGTIYDTPELMAEEEKVWKTVDL